ncbi:MAG: hypothetical protein Tsb009_10010 [Planctomycetaceae bacterium]
MNPTPSDNFISAYLDGELSPEERAHVEQLLESSSEARQLLQQFQTMGTLIRELPCEPVSEQFVSSVLSQIERTNLLPDTQPAQPLSQSEQPDKASRRPSLATLFVFGSVATTAVALFLTVRLLVTPAPIPNPSSGKSLASSSSEKSTVASSPSSNENVRREAMHNSVRPMKGASVNQPSPRSQPEKSSLAHDINPEPKLNRAKSETSPSKSSVVENRPGQQKLMTRFGATQKFRTFKAANGARGFGGVTKSFPKDQLKQNRHFQSGSIQIGDVVPYLVSQGDEMAVIEVVVVDVHKTVGRLEYLLKQNAILPAPVDKLSDDKAGNASKTRLEEKEGKKAKADFLRKEKGLIALYVESSPDQFSSAMQALTQSDENIRMALKPRVSANRLVLANLLPQPSERSIKNSANMDHSSLPTLAEAISRTRQKYYRQALQAKQARRILPATPDRTNQLPFSTKRTPAAGNSQLEKKFRNRKQSADRDGKPGSYGPALAKRPRSSSKRDASSSFHLQVRLDGKQSFRKRKNVPPSKKSAALIPGGKLAARKTLLPQANKLSAGVESAPGGVVTQPPVRVIIIFREQGETR